MRCLRPGAPADVVARTAFLWEETEAITADEAMERLGRLGVRRGVPAELVRADGSVLVAAVREWAAQLS